MAAQGLKAWSAGLAALLAFSASAAADPLEHAVAGPGRICLKQGSFLLLAGERAVDFAGGMESMRIGIEGPRGRYRIAESDFFLAQTEESDTLRSGGYADRPVDRRDGSRTYRSRGKGVGYAIYGRGPFGGQGWRMLAFIDGKALTGGAADAAIHRRYEVGETEMSRCIHSFRYGWEDFLPPE